MDGMESDDWATWDIGKSRFRGNGLGMEKSDRQLAHLPRFGRLTKIQVLK
jgi:hypothetical protein